MGLFEEMTLRVRRLDIFDVKLAQGAAGFFVLIHSKADTRNNGYQHLVVRGIADNMLDKAVLRVLVQGIVFLLQALLSDPGHIQ